MHKCVCPRILFPGLRLLNLVLCEAGVVSLWNPSILDPITVWGSIFFHPQVLLGVSLLRDPRLCTCWAGRLGCWRPLVLQEAQMDGVQVVNFVREELFCSGFGEVSLCYTFLQIPWFPIPSDNKTTICWVNKNSRDGTSLAASLSEALCLLAW